MITTQYVRQMQSIYTFKSSIRRSRESMLFIAFVVYLFCFLIILYSLHICTPISETHDPSLQQDDLSDQTNINSLDRDETHRFSLTEIIPPLVLCNVEKKASFLVSIAHSFRHILANSNDFSKQSRLFPLYIKI